MKKIILACITLQWGIINGIYGKFDDLYKVLAKNDKRELCIALFQHKENLHLCDKSGNTILHYACMQHNIHPDHIQLIFDYESINHENGVEEGLHSWQNNNGFTPFACAVFAFQPLENLKKIIDIMISSGFDPNHKNKDGNTILHLFLEKYHEQLWYHNEHQMLIFLKRIGCTLTIKNNEEKTPLDMIKNSETVNTVQDLWRCPPKRPLNLAEYGLQKKKSVWEEFSQCCLQ